VRTNIKFRLPHADFSITIFVNLQFRCSVSFKREKIIKVIDILSYSIFLTCDIIFFHLYFLFDVMSHSMFITSDIISISLYFPFDIMSHSAFIRYRTFDLIYSLHLFHIRFYVLSTYFTVRRFLIVRCFLLGRFIGENRERPRIRCQSNRHERQPRQC
jgi:hypothetical protein